MYTYERDDGGGCGTVSALGFHMIYNQSLVQNLTNVRGQSNVPEAERRSSC